MVNAQQVAATRVAFALAATSDKLKIVSFTTTNCRATTDPENALGGKFTDLGIDDSMMPLFRKILAKECPEIAADLMNVGNFPLAADMDIQLVVDAVAALLLDSGNWNGQCMPPITPPPVV